MMNKFNILFEETLSSLETTTLDEVILDFLKKKAGEPGMADEALAERFPEYVSLNEDDTSVQIRPEVLQKIDKQVMAQVDAEGIGADAGHEAFCTLHQHRDDIA